jgi:4-aminobutyrate aminotransferase-like enzyme
MERVNLWGHAAEIGEYAMRKFREIQKTNPIIGDVRGKGLMIGIELVKDEKLTPAGAEADALKDALLRNGVLIGLGGTFGNVLRFQPPLVITKQQVDYAVEAFAAALQTVAQPATV